MHRIGKIQGYASQMGLTVESINEKEEIVVVSSPELGLKNLLIDIEGDNVLFYIEIGKIKGDVDRVDLYETLLQKYNNVTTGMLSTGQFCLHTENKDVLVMCEQHLLKDMDFSEFAGMVNGFSMNLLLNIDLIKLVIEREGK